MDHTLQQKISAQGMSPEKAKEQIENFINGFPFLAIQEAASIGNGIKDLSYEELDKYKQQYSEKASSKTIIKFIPASGAASRMFKDLFSFLEGDGDISKSSFVQKFIENIEKFAFYADLDRSLKQSGSGIKEAIDQKEYQLIISHLLEDKGLGYGNLPKGLLKFHHYEDHDRTPTYEHFIEGVLYGQGNENTVRLHFTVSPEHEARFHEEINEIQPKLEKEFGVQFNVSFSQQKKATDTIAVNPDNTPFEEEDGSILFRPAGLIFIKNIDNVVPDRLKEKTKDYKMALGGLLLDIQEKIFYGIEALERKIDQDAVDFAQQVITDLLQGKLPEDYNEMDLEEKGDYLKTKLNRPLRVCGMVKNTGEPGGGPFWVKESDGSVSLQISETAQIDLDNPSQKEILQSSTHFNPVDLLCATKDYRGQKFDLLNFRDLKTGFITGKSKNGKELKAMELPGLWNGAMADWNTLFVEVPLITFNPVKTVNDLLRDEHQ